METLAKYALAYEEIGWFVLPIHPVEKKPLIRWAYRKDEQPAQEEIAEWFNKWPDARIGIATGALSGFDVVDLDGPQAMSRFEAIVGNIPETIRQKTGRIEGGHHLLFTYNGNGLKCHNGAGDNKGIDLKTDGGFIIVAPSLHKSGKRYQWQNIDPVEDGLDDLLDMPTEVVNFFKRQNGDSKERKRLTLDPVDEGARNDTLTRLSGKWINQGMDFQTAYLLAKGWNSELSEPLDIKEVRTTVESIFRTHERNHPEESSTATENLDFPSHIMTGLAGEVAKTFGDCLEAPDHFFYMSFLTVFGLSVVDTLYLLSQRKYQPRFYTILLGESADVRKSTAIEEITEFCRNFFADRIVAICRGAASGEGLAKLLLQTSKVLLFYDELKAFVSKCSIKNSTLLSATNTLFESNRYENQTSKEPIIIENGYISMLAASTTDTYAGLFDPKFMDIGFNNRLFLVPGDSDKYFPVPKPIPTDAIDYLYGRLRDCLTLINSTNGVPLDSDAEDRWADYYVRLKGSSPYAKRLDTYGLRLMPLLAVNDMKTTIDLETVETVIELIEWQHNVRQVYDPIDAEGTVANMEEKIRRAFLIQKVWPNRKLQRKVHYNRAGIWVWESAIKNLKNNDEIKYDPKTKTYIEI